MKVVRKFFIIVFTLIIIIGGVIITHITPPISIRTHLFVTGHPIGAFKANIYINKGQYEMDKDILDKENSMIYEITDFTVYDGGTGNPMSNFKVTKTWILYYAEIYGEA